MDISLIMTLTRLKFVVHANKTHFEGSMSQVLIYFLDFVLLCVEEVTLGKKRKKSRKLPVFCHKMKSRT